MANVLKMAKIQSIQQLHAAGWSQRRIARELEIDRGTVARYLQRGASRSKCSHSARRLRRAKCSHFFAACRVRAASDRVVAMAPILRRRQMQPFRPPGRRWANMPLARAAARRLPSRAWPARASASRYARVDSGQARTRALRPSGSGRTSLTEHGFTGSYDSVKRFVRQSGRGDAAAVPPDGVRRRRGSPGRLRHRRADHHRRRQAPQDARLPHRASATAARRTARRRSRQTTDDFIRCLENAFAHFGGVPKTLVIDNLKAAVAASRLVRSRAEAQGAVLLPALRHGRSCRPSPTRPGTRARSSRASST